MEISKLKLTWKYLTGGVDCVIEYLLDKFSEQVLSKADPDTLKKYCADFKAHDPDFSAGKAAIKELLGWTDEKVEEVLADCTLEN